MSDPSELDGLLIALGGTHLRNVWRAAGACSKCGGEVKPPYVDCYACGFVTADARPSASGFMIYAANGTTAGTLMHGYKAEQSLPEQQALIKLLAHRGFQHASCAEQIAGAPITHYATVPSTKARVRHPLAAWIAPFAPWPHLPLTHKAGANPKRQAAQADLFTTTACPPNAHVLVVDDTWTSGNKAFSASVTLRAAGANWVSVLCLARWVGFDFMQRPPDNASQLWRTISVQASYDLGVCPFTGAACP